MKRQVLKYHGFYMGRYEAGDGTNGATLRNGVTPAHKVVLRQGIAPYNYVPWGIEMNDKGEIPEKSGAVYLSQNLAKQEGYTSVISTLCYGSQWDAMCRYIGDSGRTTPNKAEPELTGNLSTDMSKNIYDLAGNCREWTMEANSTNRRVIRGGHYLSNQMISARNHGTVQNASDYAYSFRPTLYIK